MKSIDENLLVNSGIYSLSWDTLPQASLQIYTDRHPLSYQRWLFYLADVHKTLPAVCYPCRRSATTWWNTRYYSFEWPFGRIDLIGAHPVYYPMIARCLIVLMVEADYPLTVGSLQGTPTNVSVSSCDWRGFGPCQNSIICVWLIKENLCEVSNRCPSIQKLFSVIRDGGKNIMLQN